MEDKKKNKIFIVSSCVIASLVVALVIALMPQMQLKANRNIYQDEAAHGAAACLEYDEVDVQRTRTSTETFEAACSPRPSECSGTGVSCSSSGIGAGQCNWTMTTTETYWDTEYGDCILCPRDYTPVGKGCVETQTECNNPPANCTSWSSSCQCTQCDPDYKRSGSGCVPKTCGDYGSVSECPSSCEWNYSAGGCVAKSQTCQNPPDNCTSWSTSCQCTQCDPDYKRSGSGCVPKTCGDYGSVSECPSSCEWNYSAGGCVAKSQTCQNPPANCSSWDTSCRCTQCDSGYKKSGDGCVEKVCADYGSVSECPSSCEWNYSAGGCVAKSQTCQNPPANCSSWDTSCKCTTCDEGYVPDTDGKCKFKYNCYSASTNCGMSVGQSTPCDGTTTYATQQECNSKNEDVGCCMWYEDPDRQEFRYAKVKRANCSGEVVQDENACTSKNNDQIVDCCTWGGGQYTYSSTTRKNCENSNGEIRISKGVCEDRNNSDPVLSCCTWDSKTKGYVSSSMKRSECENQGGLVAVTESTCSQRNTLAQNDPCKIEDVSTTSVNTSKDANSKSEDSYYIGTVRVSGFCIGVQIPCNASNGRPQNSTITVVPGRTEYECIVYPEIPCIGSSVSSTINPELDKDHTANVDLIKYDWSDRPASVCEKNPAYKGNLAADAAGADVYWDNYDAERDCWTERYHRTVSCGGSTYEGPPSSEPKPACYADAASLENAKNVAWTIATDALKKGLNYKITVGVDKKTPITSENHATQCKMPDKKVEDKYCYANAPKIEDATQVAMLTEPNGKLKYQIKDTAGNPITDATICVASACYVENGTNKYTWAPIGTLDEAKYTKVAIYNDDDCKNFEACLVKTNKDGEYVEIGWFESKTEIQAKISEGWKNLGVNENQCNPGGCYQSNSNPSEYKWFKDGQDTSNYTRITDVTKCEEEPDVPYIPDEACYVRTLEDGTNEYKWGDYSDVIGYSRTLIEDDECESNVNCYLRYKDGKYYRGDYSLNPEYRLVSDINCVDLPYTAFDKSTVMYVAMICLAIAGVGLTYYGNLKRKNG